MSVKGWIEVSDIFCKGCELCVNECPQDVMSLDLMRLTPKGYHPVMLTKDGCTGCGICAIVCPEAALTVFREAPVKTAKAAQSVASTIP
jgi:2-oxoglutarate ferredoxin oxidoreductase subunit delta